MNTAAAIAFAAVMLLGFSGLTALVYRDRRATAANHLIATTAAAARPTTIYDDTINTLGDPTHLDLELPAFAWPTG